MTTSSNLGPSANARPERGRSWVALVFASFAAIALGGCRAAQPYVAKPVDPARSEASFDARSLAAPFAEAGVAAPAAGTAWTLDALTRVAMRYRSDVAVARAKANEAEAAVVTASQRPNPSISFSPMGSVNPDPGQSPWTLGLAFDWPIETACKRGTRTAQASAASEAARLGVAEAVWSARSDVRSALVEHLLAIRERDASREEVDAQARIVKTSESRFSAGEASVAEVRQARIEAGRSAVDARGAEGRVKSTRAALAQSLGVPLEALDGVLLDAAILNRLPAQDATTARALRRPAILNRLDVRRGLAEYAAAEWALALEVAKQYPDVRLGPGYEWDQGQSRFSLGVSVELPLLNRNEGPIAEAAAKRATAAAEIERVQTAAIGRLEQAAAAYEGAIGELEEAHRVEAEEDARSADAQRALESGAGDRLAVEAAHLERVAAKKRAIESLRRVGAALGSLEDTVQRPIAVVEAKPTDASKNGGAK